MTAKKNLDIDALRQRFQDLRDEKTRAEERKSAAEKKLAELKAQAVEQYETDDPEELERLLAKMSAENEKKLTEYQKSLDKIEEELERVGTEHEEETE